jgi:hypothetical protein
VRGTQSFVHTLSECWRRPSLTGLELLWRWGVGIPSLAALAWAAERVLAEAPLDRAALGRMTLTDPMGAAATLDDALSAVLPPALRIAVWLAPLLAAIWVAASALGRGVVLRRADPTLRPRPATLAVLQAVRLVALAGSFAVWFGCLRWAAAIAVNGPLAVGEEPNLVLYSAIAIVATLGLFTLWAVMSWGLAVAPLLAMRLDAGVRASLRAAFRVGELKGKLVEINLVMGIVKIALIVLAMVFSACPLPFESVATPEFMQWWYLGVTVLYLVASDFFHVVRLVSYLELWTVYDGAKGPSAAG